MKRLVSCAVMAGLVLAASARSALVQAQVAPPGAAPSKTAAPPAPPQEKPSGQKAAAQKSAVKAGDPTRKADAKKVEAAKAEAVNAREAVVKNAIVARKRRGVAVNVNANLNPMAQQFIQQGRPMMRSEVILVYSLFHPSKDQLRTLLKGAEAGLEVVAKEMAEHQQGGRRVVFQGRNPNNPDWAKRLQETVAVEFKKHLTPEQFARYQSEVDKRFAERKEAGLRFLLDAIDRELLLSPKQRDRLSAILGPKWDEGWSTYLEYLMYGNQFFPQEVDRLVTPILDDTQKKVWQGTQKVTGFWGFGGIWNFQNGEDPLERLLNETDKPAQNKPVEPAAPPPPR